MLYCNFEQVSWDKNEKDDTICRLKKNRSFLLTLVRLWALVAFVPLLISSSSFSFCSWPCSSREGTLCPWMLNEIYPKRRRKEGRGLEEREREREGVGGEVEGRLHCCLESTAVQKPIFHFQVATMDCRHHEWEQEEEEDEEVMIRSTWAEGASVEICLLSLSKL